MLSESQLLGRFFLDHEERVIILFSADAAERSEQPAGVEWFIRGAEWPNSFSSVGASTAANEVGWSMWLAA